MSKFSPAQKWDAVSIKNDLLSGLTVALALVPEAVAFSFVAGVQPLIGLHAAFMVGLLTALFGRPGMISGATGAMAIVMVDLVAQHGLPYLFAAVLLTGLLQVLAGTLRLGKFIRMVPHPVMLGFVNGLAIVIFLAQLNQFKAPGVDGTLEWLAQPQLIMMGALVLATMAIIHFLPKLTKLIPSSLAAILLVTGVSIFFGLDVRTVGDIASISGSLPEFSIPSVPLNFETLTIIFPYALILAGVGLIESLLTLTVIDEMTGTKGRPNKECLAQGLANIVNGCFGAMGGCAMIGQSMINITSGGRGRLSGVFAAISLMMFILFGSHLIEIIPIAALTGVMFMVVIGTFEWSSFRIMSQVPKADAFVIVLVSLVTVFTDLAFAVLVGVAVSALVFAWKHSCQLQVLSHQGQQGKKVYTPKGSLFFGSTQNFLEGFDITSDPKDVIIDFSQTKVCDHSAIEAVDTLHQRYSKQGKRIHVSNLSRECSSILQKAGVDVLVYS